VFILRRDPTIRRYLEILRKEMSLYGKISDAIAIKLIGNLDFVEDKQGSLRVIREFFGILSRGRSWDFAFFVPYTLSNVSRKDCTTNLLGDVGRDLLIRSFNSVIAIPDFQVQNYAYMLIIRASYLCGLTRLGDRFVSSIQIDAENPKSLERGMYVARALAAKDLGESDDLFMYIKEKIDCVFGKLNHSVLLAKLAYHLMKTFGDSESRKTARRYLEESLRIKEDYAVDSIRYLSLSLPYMFSVNTALASRFMDSLMYAAVRRKDWTEHYKDFLEESKLVVEGLDVFMRAEKWIYRVYEEKRISEDDYYKLISAARSSVIYVDPFYASSIIKSEKSPVVGVSTRNISNSIYIIKKLAQLDIPLAYELTSILMRELMSEGRYSEALEVCAELQSYFPSKIDEQYSFVIVPYLRGLRRHQIVELLPSLSLLNTDRVKSLIRNLINRAEKIANPIERASEIVSIASKISRGFPNWSRQLLLYAEELIEDYEWEEKADIVESMVETLIRINEREGLRKFQLVINHLAEIDAKRATRMIERLMQLMRSSETKTIAKQLLQYAIEKKKSIDED